ncbi:MAG: glycosyltransferase [bacterium]|nr:glycosyltransferase [bacterium]
MMPKLRILMFVDHNRSFMYVRAMKFREFIPRDRFDIRILFLDEYKKDKGKLFRLLRDLGKSIDVFYFFDIGSTKYWMALLARLFYGIRIILDVGDDYYLLNRNKDVPFFKRMKIFFIQDLFYRIADRIVTRGFFHREYMKKKGYRNVIQIPDCVDPDHSYRRSPAGLRKKLGLDKSLVIGIMGSINWNRKYRICYGWDLIEAASQLKDLKIKILVIGDGDGLPYLKNRVRELHIRDKVVFLGRVAYPDLPCYLSLFDIGISTQSNDRVGTFRTTGKLPEYLAHNIYIIATRVGEASRRLQKAGSLLPYRGIKDGSYPARLASEIRRIYFNRSLLKKALLGRKIAAQHFNYKTQAGRMASLFLSVAGKNGDGA